MKRKTKHNLVCVAMASPPVIGFILFGFIPMIISLCLSFTKLNSYDFTAARFIGTDNYVSLFKNALFGKAVVNTLYSCIAVFIQLVLGLAVAYLLTQRIKGKKAFRAVLFMPYVCSTAAAAIVWKWIFNGEFGIINSIIRSFGGKNINFLVSERWFMPCIIMMMTWAGLGYYVILFQAALTNINQSTLEAAEIDGANGFQKFFKITMPAISPTTFFLIVMGIIGGLQNFTWFQIISDGLPTGSRFGPNNAGLTIVFYLYDMGFDSLLLNGMGIASAAAWILTLAVSIITFINFKLSKRWVYYAD